MMGLYHNQQLFLALPDARTAVDVAITPVSGKVADAVGVPLSFLKTIPRLISITILQARFPHLS